MKKFAIFAVIFVTFVKSGHTLELQNVTRQVFGDHLDMLPVAFGDFNSDKLTDVIMLNPERNKISILLAEEQTFTTVLSSHTYFMLPPQNDKKKLKLECSLNDAVIESVTPGDFDGDGGMDLLILVTEDDDPSFYRAFVMWGDHKQSDGKHSLICLEKSLEQGWHHKFNTSHHPINIDANGDYVTDLFGVPQNQTISSRGVWTFSSSRKDPPKLSYLMGRDLGPMKKPHSNSFVDLDGDGNADLIVTSEDYFELWHNDGKKESDNGSFVHIKNIKLPADCKPSQDTCAVGQLAFSDFDLDGKLDLVFPVCHDGKDCSNSTMYFTTTKKLWFANKDDDNVFTPMTIDLRTWRFHFLEDPIYSALAPRIGDINLDGYPDLLVRMKNPSTSTYQTHLLLNVVVDAGDEIIISNLKRGFLLQDKIMEGIPDSVMATFYDLYENGIEDMILVQKLDDDKYRIGAFTNLTQDSDAYFVKVIVLSGRCFDDCYQDHIKVPYGTNYPGQTICYRTQRPGLEEGFGEIESCAPQLTQTAHTALQLPYTIFGLGLAPNFLDYMFVNVTNTTSSSRSHTWSQIIPNSQMYVIPNPPNKPNKWEAKLFITPSRGITLTGLALVGTCGLVMVLIVFLHWRERRADLREKLQEAHRFHFDAM